MSEYGFDYQLVQVGDILEFPGFEAKLTVVEIRNVIGRRGMYGDTPSTTEFTFADGTYVKYDPWVEFRIHFRPFRVVGNDSSGLTPARTRNSIAYL